MNQHLENKIYKALKRRVWHPLKPIRTVILLFIIAVVISYFILPFLFDFIKIINSETQNIIFTFCSRVLNSFIIPFIIPLIVAILIFYFGIIEKERLQYADGLTKLICEMNLNYRSILKFPQEVEKKYESKNEGELEWLSKKLSYTNWGDGENFHYKYLSTSAYFNFINNGYILNTKYLGIPSANIGNFYFQCFKFNIAIQTIENSIHMSNNEVDKQEKKPIEFTLDGKKFKFDSVNNLCTFLKNDFCQYYSCKNYLNQGLIGEYKITIRQLEKYIDINKKCSD